MEKYTCPCCGYKTLDTEHDYQICPICFWEDDFFQFEDPFLDGGPNHISLVQAQINYITFGACKFTMKTHVRIPNKSDEYDLNWKPCLQLDSDLWCYIDNEREFYKKELQRELSKKHVLYGIDVVEIANRDDKDDVLFMLNDESNRFAVVHLTYKGDVESNPIFPITRIYSELEELNHYENI